MKPEHVKAIEKDLIDQGKIIEAGFAGFRIMAIPSNAPQIQVDEMRNAFFAGAQHLLGSIMSTLDEGEQETEDDMRRMLLIADELDRFIAEFSAKHYLGDPREVRK